MRVFSGAISRSFFALTFALVQASPLRQDSGSSGRTNRRGFQISS